MDQMETQMIDESEIPPLDLEDVSWPILYTSLFVGGMEHYKGFHIMWWSKSQISCMRNQCGTSAMDANIPICPGDESSESAKMTDNEV